MQLSPESAVMQLRDTGVPFSPPSFDYGADARELLLQLDREANCKGVSSKLEFFLCTYFEFFWR